MEIQKILNSQSNLEKEEWNWKNQPPDFRLYYKATVIYTVMVLAQRQTLHNDHKINPRRRYNNYKYICTQHRSTAIWKTNANKHERGN